MNAPDKETEIAQNKKHHHKQDTSIIQETLFKENPEDTKSIEFVDTHTINCNDSMTPSRVKSQEHLQQDTQTLLPFMYSKIQSKASVEVTASFYAQHQNAMALLCIQRKISLECPAIL